MVLPIARFVAEASNRNLFNSRNTRSRRLTIRTVQSGFFMRFQHFKRLLITLNLTFKQPAVVLVKVAKMLGFCGNGLPALNNIVIGAALWILLSAALLLQIIQRCQKRTFVFSNPLQRAAVDVTGREMLLFSVHYRFQVVQDYRHLIQYF
ncbi:hypothetical protein ENASMMO064B1_06480 [Enterobacter asburiae]